MRRKLIVIVVLMIAGVLLWVYTSMQYTIWDGGFELTIHVSSDPGPPRSVSCQAFGSRQDAEYVLTRLIHPERLWSIVADPFNGEALILNVPLSGHDSMSGRELVRFQFRYLVVIAVLPDGRRVGKLVEIPDCRVSREVSVVLP